MAELSFTQAIETTAALLASLHGREPEAREIDQLQELTATIEAARGFFVALLTGNSSLADEPPPYLVAAVERSAPLSCDLLVKNLVMSTTMALTHEQNGDLEQAAGSKLVSRRSALLISKVEIAEMQLRLSEMIEAIDGKISQTLLQESSYTKFLERMSYNEQQLTAAREAAGKLHKLSTTAD